VDKVQVVFSKVDSGQIQAVTCVITITETLTKPLKDQDKKVELAYRNLLQSRNLTVSPITSRIADRAADLRSRYNLRTPDALHVATAIDTQADAFLTNDKGLKRIAEIPVLILDEFDLDT
jgi:predicted nucleic acid-binding protein